MLPLVDAIPPVRGRRGRPRRRPRIHEAFLAIGCSLICLKLLQGDATPS